MAKNKHKWLYDQNDITLLNAGLDGIAGGLELEGTDEAKGSAKLIRGAIEALFKLSEQQIHLATAIEALKKKLNDQTD